MKLLTVNFLTCAVKACKSSALAFPLHFRDAELERLEIEYDPRLLRNMLARLDWDAITVTAGELSFTTLPPVKPTVSSASDAELRALHTLLLETEVREGKLVCGNCGHEYRIKEGIANFLLPGHLGPGISIHGQRRAGKGKEQGGPQKP